MNSTTDLTTRENSGPPSEVSSNTQIEQSRAVQEVQAMMIVAKKFPRDETEVLAKVIKACQRKSLAEVSRYVYPKGKTSIQGTSIRLAETLARIWGNMVYGLQEISRHGGWSEMEAYAWDLENNTRRSIKFRVEHIMFTKKGNYDLEDPREIYEMTANQGARRVRACILGIIPGDIVEAAEEQCEKTLKLGQFGPIEDRIQNMIASFAEIGVTKNQLEKRLGHKIEATVEAELITLRKIFVSIKDEMGKREDYFDSNTPPAGEKAGSPSIGAGGPPESAAQPPAGSPPVGPIPAGEVAGPSPSKEGPEAKGSSGPVSDESSIGKKKINTQILDVRARKSISTGEVIYTVYALMNANEVGFRCSKQIAEEAKKEKGTGYPHEIEYVEVNGGLEIKSLKKIEPQE